MKFQKPVLSDAQNELVALLLADFVNLPTQEKFRVCESLMGMYNNTDLDQISYESDVLSPTVAQAFKRHLDTMEVPYEVSGDGTYTVFLVSGPLTPRQLQHILRLEEFCIARNLPVTNVPLIGELKI